MLHTAVAEVVAKRETRVQWTTVQNWSTNVYNLGTKRAIAYDEANVFWLDCNTGSKLTMKYPGVYLMGPKARAEILSVSLAGAGQHQDNGGRIIHAAPETSSTISAKSISMGGGRTSYRGLVRVRRGAKGVRSNVRCDALILDPQSRSDTYPYIELDEGDVSVGHEATVQRIDDDQLFYMMTRGIPEAEAMKMIVNGFIEPIVKELPMEYAVEMNRLVEIQMDDAIG
jgi:Fe-S cluster assembly protein SufB